MNFDPVATVADLKTLDQDQIAEGYVSTKRGDPEPGENRGRSFWHGWRNRMMDFGEIPIDNAARMLVRECVQSGYLRKLVK
jgi:hypothetical protein